MPPSEAFDLVGEELVEALGRRGIDLSLSRGKHILERTGDVELGRVTSVDRGKRIRLDWHAPPWQPGEKVSVDVRFKAIEGGTRVTFEQRGWSGLVGDPSGEMAGWFSSEVGAAFLGVMTPARFGDWLTDRRARRPSGRQAKAVYRDPQYHRPNFLAILEALKLTEADDLLEVGCGGGAFLHDALRSGCQAAAIDHSAGMVKVASEVNRAAIKAGRLTITEAEADRLPVPDDRFTCAVMTGVFGFLDDPVAALREIHRALRDGGRLVLFTGTSALRGTPAAPEPMASRLHFYDDAELVRLAKDAGFGDARVERPNLEPHARAVGVPKEAIPLFRGTGRLLIARK